MGRTAHWIIHGSVKNAIITLHALLYTWNCVLSVWHIFPKQGAGSAALEIGFDLNQQRNDMLTVLQYGLKRSLKRGSHHVPSVAQVEYVRAWQSYKQDQQTKNKSIQKVRAGQNYGHTRGPTAQSALQVVNGR